ncbi:SHD1 domain-containing protein [Pontiellaceae bacterium B1224]|nr:SHD1 domain-containing protein [Pontiellaceae bacterium B1224]
MKKYLVALCVLMGLTFSVSAEMRIWSDKKGNTIEAEYVSVIGSKVVLKTPEGKTLKVTMSGLSAADKKFLASSIPPTIKIDVDIDKDEEKMHDSGYSVSKKETVSCQVELQKTSKEPCNREFTVHAYIFAESLRDNSKKIIIHKEQKLDFKNTAKVSFASGSASVQNYKGWSSTSNGKYGAEYHGYLVIVEDDRGNVIAVESNQTTYEKNIASIKGKDVGTRFDKNYRILTEKEPNVGYYYW